MIRNMKLKLAVVGVAAVLSGNAFADVITGGGTVNEPGSTTLLVDDTGSNNAGASVLIDGNAGSVAATAPGGNSNTIDGNSITFNNNQGALSGVSTINGTSVSSFATTTQINALDSKIDSVAKKAYAGIASVAALAAIPGPAAGKQFAVGVGVGNYAGQQAIAIGANASFGQNINVKAGFGVSDGKTTANAGASFSW